MPEIPLSTDQGPSPGVAGIESGQEVAASGLIALRNGQEATRQIQQLGQVLSRDFFALKERQLQADIQMEALRASEQLSTAEVELRTTVMQDTSIPPSQKSAVYLDRFGALQEEVTGEMRFVPSQMAARRRAIEMARDGRFVLERASFALSKAEAERALDTAVDAQKRAALSPDPGDLLRARQGVAQAAEAAGIFLEPGEVSARLAAGARAEDSLQLSREVNDLLEGGEILAAERLARDTEQFSLASPEQRNALITKAAARARAVALGLEGTSKAAADRFVNQTINALSVAAEDIQAARRDLDPSDPEFEAKAAALETRQLELEARALEARPRIATLASREDFAAFQSAVSDLSEGVSAPATLAAIDGLMRDAAVSSDEVVGELHRALASKTISRADFNTRMAIERQSTEKGNVIREAEDRLEAAFGKASRGVSLGSVGLSFGQAANLEQLETAAVQEYRQFVRQNPQATRQQLFETVDRLIVRFDRSLPPVHTLSPPPEVAAAMREAGAQVPSEQHIEAARGRMALELETAYAALAGGELDAFETAFERREANIDAFGRRLILAAEAERKQKEQSGGF